MFLKHFKYEMYKPCQISLWLPGSSDFNTRLPGASELQAQMWLVRWDSSTFLPCSAPLRDLLEALPLGLSSAQAGGSELQQF